MEGETDQAGDLRKRILAVSNDPTLSDAEKARKRQEIMCGGWKAPAEAEAEVADNKGKGPASQPDAEQTTVLDETLKCAFCFNLCERPVTAPCQHNFCLGCFNKWVAKGNKTCPTCRHSFPAKFAANPRINTALAAAIRLAKQGPSQRQSKEAIQRIADKDRPDEAFVTDRAVRAGRANAASGRIMVEVPGDHFGPIPASADPRGLGVRVGEWWKDRLDCRQWGAHFPHVAGIAGQSGVGAQSVVLSGGYEDDRDEGEWFLYTGSGGRDLSGNKRISKVQSFDQVFENMNKALKLSCIKGLPVRVVRSFKEKRSAYAPSEETPVRYDGIYRIASCWRKPGAQGKLMCRYLFIRCDNEPAPWSSEDCGDKPTEEIPKEALKEQKQAKGPVIMQAADPWWSWDGKKNAWGWTREAPVSQKQGGDPNCPKKLRRKASEQEKALREFACQLCKAVLHQPVSTPCGHNFCKPCLEKKFEGVGDVAVGRSERVMRVRKLPKPCPACNADIADFLAHAQENKEMAAVIAQLQADARKAQEAAEKQEAGADAAADDAAVGSDAAEDAAEAVEEDVDDAPDDPAACSPEEPAAEVSIPAPAPASEAATGPSTSAAAAPSNAGGSAALKEDGIAALAAEFPEYDAELIGAMAADQDGDLEEVRFYLRKMKNQAVAAERKAAAAAKGKATLRAAEAKAAAPNGVKAAASDSTEESTGVAVTTGKGKKRVMPAPEGAAAAKAAKRTRGGR